MDLSTVMTQDAMCHHNPFHEEALVVLAAKNGDNAAFDVLAARYRRRILNTVGHITGSFDDAEDVTQEALIKAFVKIGSFRGTSSFSSWLTRIAINQALMWKRRPVRRAEVGWLNGPDLDEPGSVREFADTRPNPEECYRAQEQGDILLTVSKGLKPVMRQALEMCDLNEGSMKDLALIQGTSLSAAKARLFRGRKQIRARLEYLLRRKATDYVRAKSRVCVHEPAAAPGSRTENQL